MHRDEASGTLHGLLRMKQFTQDDGHIFCAPDHVEPEAERFCRELFAFYRRFGFADLSIALSLRPPPDARLGDDAIWDRAERILEGVVARLGVPYEVQPGGGAIYGPKIELLLRDRRGRAWQCGTLQIDFVMPERFDLRYVDAGGERRHVAILHRALFGSLERFLGVLLEHHGAELPAWLAPEQVAVIPVGAAHAAPAAAACRALTAAGLRARLDADAATLSRRVLRAHHDGVSFVVVLGARELEAGTLAARDRAGTWSGPAADVVAELARRCAPPG